MKNKLAIISTTLLAITTSLLLHRPIVRAQKELSQISLSGLSINPPTVEILLAPNKNVIQTIDIKNQGESAQFVASLHTFMPNGSDGLGNIDPHPLDPAKLPIVITIQNADIKLGQPFALAGGESQQLVIQVEAANVDTSEDAYVALVVTTVDKKQELVTATAGIASLIFVTVTPDGILPLDLSVQDFTLPYLTDSLTPIDIGFTLSNNTTVMVKPEGSLAILSPRGNHNQEFKLYPNLILGSSSRRGMIQSHDNPPRPLNPTWEPGKWTFGPFLIRLTITTPGGRKLQEVEKTVWVLPIRLLLTGVLTILVISLFIIKTRRNKPIDTTTQTL